MPRLPAWTQAIPMLHRIRRQRRLARVARNTDAWLAAMPQHPQIRVQHTKEHAR